MALTILIKFCGFILYSSLLSKPNNMTLSAFPGKILETRQIVFNFLPVASPNVAPKPTGQSRSTFDTQSPLANISSLFFSFSIYPQNYSSDKCKIFIFSKMATTIFIKFCEFIVHSNPKNMELSAFPGKSLYLEKYFLILYLLLTQCLNQLTNLVQILYLGSSCNYLQPVLFIFDLALILRVP